MKATVLCWPLLFLSLVYLPGQEPTRLESRKLPSGDLEFRWRSEPRVEIRDGVREFEIQKSSDLRQWNSVRSQEAGFDAEEFRIQLPAPANQQFFRLMELVFTDTPPGAGPSAFGFSRLFKNELRPLGLLSPAAFWELFPNTNSYLKRIRWDPRTGKYWDQFNLDIHQYNATNTTPEVRSFDLRLNDAELAKFTNQGFVVSERLGTYSFAETFHRIYADDLPVFISTDAMLQAWHLSFQNMMREMETLYAIPSLLSMLNGMRGLIPQVWAEHGSGLLRSNILDADYYLSVAQSLLEGTNRPSLLGQESRVADTIQKINAGQPIYGMGGYTLFGRGRDMDFSQFKVRGHYTQNPALSNYFRAMMWCGRVDFRIGNSLDLRELGGSILLTQLLAQSGGMETFLALNRIIERFVGWTDSATFSQLQDLLRAEGIDGLSDISNTNVLQRIAQRIFEGTLGIQNIRGDLYQSPLSSVQIKLPRSITFIGQKFVLDSWVFSKVVFDSIIWDENGIPEFRDKVMRRIPSALDMAFAVLRNDEIVPLLVSRMVRTNGVPYRDGLPYQHNLAAARKVIEQLRPEAWDSSIYFQWLDCLRELSVPTTDARFPDSMRTRAYANKRLNTQLASWTQLRHDTILYAKPSYTGNIICSYPAGFVEPIVGFWEKIGRMARSTATAMEAIYPTNHYALTNQPVFLRRFAENMDQLGRLAAKELSQTPFTQEENQFVDNLIELRSNYAGVRSFSGWYPTLFYRPFHDNGFSFQLDSGSDKSDALITDVHTDPEDGVSPGHVLHEAVGNVHLMMIAIDNGPDRMVYAGPVLSHYEFCERFPVRRDDNQWKGILLGTERPPSPEWTTGFLVPGPMDNPDRSRYFTPRP